MLTAPFNVAVNAALTLVVEMLPAVTMKLAVVAPALTVTVGGTGAAPGLLDEIATVDPPAGAAGDTDTVQVVVAPDATGFGEHAKAETVVVEAGGATVTEVVALPFSAAVTVTV